MPCSCDKWVTMHERDMNRWIVLIAAALLVFSAACGGDDNDDTGDAGMDDTGDAGMDDTGDAGMDDTGDAGMDDTGDAGTDDTGDTGGDADDGGADGGDDADSGSDIDAGDTTAPTVGVTVTANPRNVLSAYVDVSIDEPSAITVRVTQTDGDWEWTGSSDGVVPSDELVTFFVMGMYAETDYTVSVSATDEAANEGTGASDYTSPALPEDFPPIAVAVSQPEMMSGEYTMFPVFRWNPGNDAEWGYVIVLDASGAPVWYYSTESGGGDNRILPNGNIGLVLDDERFLEVDWEGNVVEEILAEDIGIDSIHHEWYTLPDGDVVFLGSELQNIDGYPDPEMMGGTVAYDVIGDVIAVYDPDTETITETISTFDFLDPLNVRAGFNNPFWNQHYADVAPDGVKDWTHGNAVIYDAEDDAFIASIRHQDMVVKVDRATGDLIWATGPDGTLNLASGEWTYQQHAPELQPDGSILVYDNGGSREGLGDGETPYTRVIVFEVDESDADAGNWTFTQTWEYLGEEAYLAPFVGDADMLDGTVLICDGGLVADPTLGIGLPENQKLARIREVTFEETPTVVFEVNIVDESETDPIGYTVYRAERIETLGVPAQ